MCSGAIVYSQEAVYAFMICRNGKLSYGRDWIFLTESYPHRLHLVFRYVLWRWLLSSYAGMQVGCSFSEQ